MRVTIYTDGGADPNPGVGGWAAILQANGRRRELTGTEPHTTNNRMELTAAVEALKALKRPSQVDFYTDSQYLQQGISEWIGRWRAKGWRRGRKPVANADLWQELDRLAGQHEIEWHWVRGHTGDRLNERADRLARRARLEITAGPETEAGVARVYARVAFKGPAGPGAWGLILESAGGETQQFSAVEDKTTNNRLELQAVIESLRLVSAGSRIQLVTSSDYVYQGATRWLAGWRQGGWKTKAGKPVSNQDLWRELEALAAVREVRWLSAKQIGAEPALDEAARVAAEALRAAL